MNISAIETEYKGYKFRSRLEARWAVFFDEAGIDWGYEIEGYNLSNGAKYLPDFYLPQFKVFVEIKPFVQKGANWNDVKEQIKQWEDKCAQFRTDTGKAILIVYGDPAEDIWGHLFAWVSDTSFKTYEYNGSARFISVGDRLDPEIVIMTENGEQRLICIDKSGNTNKKVINATMMVLFYWENALFLLQRQMYDCFDEKEASIDGTFDNIRKKARQARFEYGENGRKRKQCRNNVPAAKRYKPEDDMGNFMRQIEEMHPEQYAIVLSKVVDIQGGDCVWHFDKQIRLLDLYREYNFQPTGELEHEEEIRTAISNGNYFRSPN